MHNGSLARRREYVARLLILVYALGTLTAFVGWTVLRWTHRPRSWAELVFYLANVPVAHSALSIVVMGVITVALLPRKRIALTAVGAFQAFGIVLGLAQWLESPLADRFYQWWSGTPDPGMLDILSIPLGIIGLATVIWLWPVFPARLRPGVLWPTLGTLLGGGLVTAAVTYGLLWLAVPERAGVRLQDTAALMMRVLGLQSPGARLHSSVPGWTLEVVSLSMGLTVLAAVFTLIRSGRDPNGWRPEQELLLRRLLAEHGEADSLGYFATRRDKDAVFDPGRRAAVTYRVVGGVSLASGDPIGDPEHWHEAIVEWLRYTRTFGWIPAVLAASEAGARAYSAQGFRVINLGDEAILHPEAWAGQADALGRVRHAAKHAENEGLRVEILRQADISADALSQEAAAAASWRQGAIERGFSMALNRLADPSDSRTLHVIARDAAGEPMGLLVFVPWGWRGASLDVMRRSPDAPHGVTELMVSELVRRAPDLGISRISLNFCMFRSVYADAAEFGSSVVTRWNQTVLGALDRFWQLERLYRANRQYLPQWLPRYLCYQDVLALPQIGLAAGAAEGFVPSVSLTRGESAVHRLSPVHLAALAEIERPPQVDLATLEPPRTSEQRSRRVRARAMMDAGIQPWPAVSKRPNTELPGLGGLREGSTVTVSGRLGRIRDHGGVLFADLRDGSASIQLLAERGVAVPAVDDMMHFLDPGDLVLVSGVVGRSRTGTRSLVVREWSVVGKSLTPLPPASWEDPAARARRREADLIVHPEAAQALRARTAVLRAVRATLDARGFTEVETPVLHTVHGGANARPFRTRSFAYGKDLVLRIAPELFLKRLVVAGMGPIYEVSRNFRNEGVDATHNPEFSSLEAYQPFADYTDMRLLTEELVRAAAVSVLGRPVLPLDGIEVNLDEPFPVISVLDAVSDAVGVRVGPDDDLGKLHGLARESGLETAPEASAGQIIEKLYEVHVEKKTVRPTFYVDFPLETSPLTRPHRSIPGLVERWDLVVGGLELGTAYTELTDPIDQRRRLTQQSLLAASGDPEAMEVDEDFLGALELGMPPTGGLGIGLDRLVMLVTGLPIRGVLSFPFAR